jgi:MFS family permease
MKRLFNISVVVVSWLSTSSSFVIPSTYGRTRTNLSKDNNEVVGFTAVSNNNEVTVFGFPRDTVARPLSLFLTSQFLLFIGIGAIIPSIPLYGKEIGLSGAANGFVISAPAVSLLLGANRGGALADMARKPSMLLGMAVIAVADLGTSLANSLPTLLLARLGLGAGRCMSEAGERGMLADWATQAPELRGRALAAQQVVAALGIAIGAPLGGIVVETFGPRAAFLCVSAAATAAFTIYLVLPETIELSTKDRRQTTDTVRLDGDWKRLLTISQWQGLALCQAGATFGFAAKIASIPLLATAILPGGAVGAGVLVSMTGLSGIVGAPIGGWLTDKTSAKSTAILSGILSAAGLMLVPVALSLDDANVAFLGLDNQAAAFCSTVIVWSLGASAQGPALTALAQELAPATATATAMALPRATGDGTYIVAPFLLGVIADSSLPLGTECAAAGAATLCGILALALLNDDGIDAKRA